MHITDIRLQHFRSYQDESFELAPGVNIIVGPNASGKTNLLEAVLVQALGASYRVKDVELIQFDQPWARLDAHTVNGMRTVKLERNGEAVKKSFTIDDLPFQRLSLQKQMPVVLFQPNHLLLLSGAPDLRRAFLDDLLEQTVPGYGTLRRQYRRTLAQRNALLKKGYAQARDHLFAWNVRLSELGGRLVVERSDLVKRFNERILELYGALSSSKTTVSLKYITQCDVTHYSTQLLHKLEAHVLQDCERGFTAHGPHRDDLAVYLDGHQATETASRGETRTVLLALKILELELLEEIREQKPLLLLDDVFSELDGARRQALTRYLESYQTFITTTDADVVVQHFMDRCAIIPMT